MCSSDAGVKCANVRAKASNSIVKHVREGTDCFILSPCSVAPMSTDGSGAD